MPRPLLSGWRGYLKVQAEKAVDLLKAAAAFAVHHLFSKRSAFDGALFSFSCDAYRASGDRPR